MSAVLCAVRASFCTFESAELLAHPAVRNNNNTAAAKSGVGLCVSIISIISPELPLAADPHQGHLTSIPVGRELVGQSD